MIDFHKQIKTALSGVLPTHYEMTLHSGLKTPCYSYMELNNYVDTNGDTIGYSRVSFQVKVWGKDIAIIQRYAAEADKVLRPLGLKRTASGELYDRTTTMIQKILTYEGLALEDF